MFFMLRLAYFLCLFLSIFAIVNPALCKTGKNAGAKALHLFTEAGYSGAYKSAGQFYSGYNGGATLLLKVVSKSFVSFVIGGGASYETLFYKASGSSNTSYTLDGLTYKEVVDYKTNEKIDTLFLLGQGGLGFFLSSRYPLYTLVSIGSSGTSSQARGAYQHTTLTYSTHASYGNKQKNYKTSYPSQKAGGVVRVLHTFKRRFDIGCEVGLYSLNIDSTYYKNLNLDFILSYAF